MESKVLLIIPAYNEEKNIIQVVESAKKANVDILVINDGSTDNTRLICEENNIACVNLIYNLGIGGAVQTGYLYAYYQNYDIAVQFDGDGQHNIEDLSNLIEPIISNKSDFCIGSRFLSSSQGGFRSSLTRRIGIRLISRLIYIFTKKKISDPTSGYRAANRKVIKEFANNYPLEYPEPESTTYLLKKGYRVKEVAVTMNPRVEGKSSIHSWKNIYYMLNVGLSILMVSTGRKK